ncbi:MAG: condensation domain-containing protein, partial [Blastocatellia bacterium]
TEAFSVEEEVYVGLKELSQRAGVTLFITLLTAFVTLLHLHTGDEDISVGTDVANRTRGETEGLIGFFVNQLVIRADMSGDPAFLAMLKRMREVILEAYNYQDVPFDVLVEAINPIRSPKHAPLFQVKILLQDALKMRVELEDVTITPVDIGRSTAQLDLIVNLINTSEYLIGQADYSLDVFKHQDVVRLIANFKALLRSIVADPERRLSQLSRLSENETGGYEPGDFVDAGLTQSEFDNLIMEIGAEPVPE